MEKNREMLKNQLVDLYNRAVNDYLAQYKTQKRIEKRNTNCKVLHIILSLVATGGFLVAIVTKDYLMSWIGGAASALSLGLNLYIKENGFDLMYHHKSASDELWDVKEAYLSLITDFEALAIEDIRIRRDEIQEKWSYVNKRYLKSNKNIINSIQTNALNMDDLGKNKYEESNSVTMKQIEKEVDALKLESEKEHDIASLTDINEIKEDTVNLDLAKKQDEEALSEAIADEVNLETDIISKTLDDVILETNQQLDEVIDEEAIEEEIKEAKELEEIDENGLSAMLDSMEELQKTENLRIDSILSSLGDNSQLADEDEKNNDVLVEEKNDEDLSPEEFLEKNIERYPNVAKNKIISISKQVNKMMDAIDNEDFVHLKHIIKFKNVDSKMKYMAIASVEGYSTECSNKNDLELFVSNSIENNLIILTKSILQLAQDVTEYDGSYYGWALKN